MRKQQKEALMIIGILVLIGFLLWMGEFYNA